jgi:hypothetical protein
MSNKKVLLLVGVLIAAAFVLTACAGPAGAEGPAGPAGPAGAVGPAGPALTTADLSCTECHNDTTDLTGKVVSWEESVHGSGTATAYAGGRKGCAGCHSGVGFSDRIAAGVTNMDKFTTTYANPSRPDCRACHQIHTTYTAADWALETVAPVAFYAAADTTKATFDGGLGNLCANCHQPRTVFTPATDGKVEITSKRYGPHHGPQSELLLGTGGAGLEGSPSAHYSLVENTCVACHMGEGNSHSFDPQLATCVACHADAKNFDINGAQAELEAKMADLQAKLLAAGMLDKDGYAVPGIYTEAQANAIWNYRFIALEDKSSGVHNAAYANALIDAALLAFP